MSSSISPYRPRSSSSYMSSNSSQDAQSTSSSPTLNLSSRHVRSLSSRIPSISSQKDAHLSSVIPKLNEYIEKCSKEHIWGSKEDFDNIDIIAGENIPSALRNKIPDIAKKLKDIYFETLNRKLLSLGEKELKSFCIKYSKDNYSKAQMMNLSGLVTKMQKEHLEKEGVLGRLGITKKQITWLTEEHRKVLQDQARSRYAQIRALQEGNKRAVFEHLESRLENGEKTVIEFSEENLKLAYQLNCSRMFELLVKEKLERLKKEGKAWNQNKNTVFTALFTQDLDSQHNKEYSDRTVFSSNFFHQWKEYFIVDRGTVEGNEEAIRNAWLNNLTHYLLTQPPILIYQYTVRTHDFRLAWITRLLLSVHPYNKSFDEDEEVMKARAAFEKEFSAFFIKEQDRMIRENRSGSFPLISLGQGPVTEGSVEKEFSQQLNARVERIKRDRASEVELMTITPEYLREKAEEYCKFFEDANATWLTEKHWKKISSSTSSQGIYRDCVQREKNMSKLMSYIELRLGNNLPTRIELSERNLKAAYEFRCPLTFKYLVDEEIKRLEALSPGRRISVNEIFAGFFISELNNERYKQYSNLGATFFDTWKDFLIMANTSEKIQKDIKQAWIDNLSHYLSKQSSAILLSQYALHTGDRTLAWCARLSACEKLGQDTKIIQLQDELKKKLEEKFEEFFRYQVADIETEMVKIINELNERNPLPKKPVVSTSSSENSSAISLNGLAAPVPLGENCVGSLGIPQLIGSYLCELPVKKSQVNWVF